MHYGKGPQVIAQSVVLFGYVIKAGIMLTEVVRFCYARPSFPDCYPCRVGIQPLTPTFSNLHASLHIATTSRLTSHPNSRRALLTSA